MKPHALAIAVSIVAAGATLCTGCASHRTFLGPAPVRNQHPAQLTALHLDPISAEPIEEGETKVRIDAAYSSYWLIANQGSGASARGIVLDGELLRLSYKARIGLPAGLELDAELPVGYANGGWLDDFVVDYHDTFSLPNQGRSTAARDRFGVSATRGGTAVYAMNPGAVELMDLPIALAWHVLPCDADHPFGLAIRGGFEVPIGDSHRGYGNGRLDTALGLVGEARVGAFSVTGFVQHAFVGTPFRARKAGLSYADVDAAGVGIEALVTDDLSALVQAELESSVLGELHFRQASHAQGTLYVGGRLLLGDSTALELGLVEDLTRRTSPDFTAYAAVAFGARRKHP